MKSLCLNKKEAEKISVSNSVFYQERFKKFMNEKVFGVNENNL